MKDYYLDNWDYNVFAVDWSYSSMSPVYYQAAAETRVVGLQIAYFIQRLVNTTNATVADMHCIGHSLGAQVCGFVGQRLQNPKMPQITGLDPAGPTFMDDKPNTRLDPTDAELVLVIHTNAGTYSESFRRQTTVITKLLNRLSDPFGAIGILGNMRNVGHFDFWPNGGMALMIQKSL